MFGHLRLGAISYPPQDFGTFSTVCGAKYMMYIGIQIQSKVMLGKVLQSIQVSFCNVTDIPVEFQQHVSYTFIDVQHT